MPSKKKPAPQLPAIPEELIDQFVTGPMSAEAVQAASMAFKKALIERALGAEMSHHLGYPPGAAKPEAAGNHRNGRSAKTVLTEDGPLRIEVPRDRAGSFEPILIPKRSLPRQVDTSKPETSGLKLLGMNCAGGTSPSDSCGRYSL